MRRAVDLPRPFQPLLFHGLVRPLRKVIHLALRAMGKGHHELARLNDRFLAAAARHRVIKTFDSPERARLERYLAGLTDVVARLSSRPTISIVMPVHRVPHAFLREALASVAIQTYPHWQLCAVDDASGDPEIKRILDDFAAAHPGKVAVEVNASNVHISATSNRCLELATGEFVTFLDHDDRLYPNALAEMVRHLHYFDVPDVMYSDSRPVDEQGDLFHEFFFYKPDWSPFLHLSFHYTAHMTLYRTALVRQVGGFRVGFEGSQDYDLMLRMVEATKKPVAHVALSLYQWRVHASSTAGTVASKPYAVEAARKALREACERRGRPVEDVEFEWNREHYRVRFALPEQLPLVSIIIPTRNAYDLIRPCLESLFATTTYPALEVLVVDNGTDDPACLRLFKDLETREGARFRRIDAPGPFNFARLNNRAAREARGEYLILLNNDTEVSKPDWIHEMLRYAQFPEVGAVGAKLHFADASVQHAGLFTANQAIAASFLETEGDRGSFYYHLINSPREVSAVTAACLMIAKAKYDELDGLDEIYTPNGYGDVDFCLRLRERGYTNVYTPYAHLYHYESRTRGSAVETFERTYMLRRWGGALAYDPYLNVNLARASYIERAGFPMPEIEGQDFNWFLQQDPWFVGQDRG